MNGTLGNYLAQLGGYSQTPGSATNPNATPTKPMNEWGMEDYMSALANRQGQSGNGGASGNTSNLGRALAGGLNGMQTGTGFMAGAKAAGGAAGLVSSL